MIKRLPIRLWQKSNPQSNFTGKTNPRRKRASRTEPDLGATNVEGSPRATSTGWLMSRYRLLKNTAFRLRCGETHQAADRSRNTDLVHRFIHDNASRNSGPDQQRENLVSGPRVEMMLTGNVDQRVVVASAIRDHDENGVVAIFGVGFDRRH